MPKGVERPQGVTTSAIHTLDVTFTLRGNDVPVDHGYALYAALSRLPGAGPWLHHSETLGIHPIRGHYAGDGMLKLTLESRLRLRLPAGDLPYVLPLAGKSIDVNGNRLRIGVPQTALLQPTVALYAHVVTTRNGQDEARFDAEIQHQLDTLGVQGKPTRGKRRVLRVRDKTVVGHSLLVSELTAEESVRLQEAGLGGRRKMGCGLFSPWRS
jgi:CRISPR-associated protein Cas6